MEYFLIFISAIFVNNNYGFIVNYGLNTDVLFLSMCGIQIGMALSNAKSVQ